jgi:alpha-glucosidase
MTTSKFLSADILSTGKYLSHAAHEKEILIQGEHATCKISFYDEAIVRINYSSTEEFEEFSYALVSQPVSIEYQIVESVDHLLISSNRLHIHIDKSTLALQFKNQEHQVINEDVHGLGTSWIGEQVTCYKKLQPNERFIGLGEKTGPLDKKGHGYTNWNTDSFAYSSGQDPLYCTTPFYIGLHNQLAYGIFFDNSHKSFFNFGASNNRFSSFGADAGEMNYYFIYGDHVAEIIQGYTYLTGNMPLPPKWSLGYQQCRYSYYPDKEVLSVARTFREKNIPADTIVFDIHYMDAYKIFTWSKKDFPDPKSMIDQLKDMGFNVVVMCDPGIKVEQGYDAYDDGLQKNVFLKYPDGENYTGQVWPGWCHFPDFTKAEVREWWGNKFKEYVDLGIEGFWNDMNEIATWGHSLPENIVFDFEGRKATTRRGRNIFGMQMSRSTFEGTRTLMNGKRPFNLTRSAYSGIQRYAAVWTGDNVAYDEHMMLGVRMVNGMGLTGIAFAGYDVGGFVGDASTNLFVRWLSIGALSPFFRGHSMINSRDSEPWSYGEEAEQICRNYIGLRYQLMPYIYSLFYEASHSGMPVQRSLAIDYSFYDKVFDHRFHHQYLFGSFILVAPVESNKDIAKVWLPPGSWYSLYNGERFDGNKEIIVDCPLYRLPVFIKAGAIIPMQQITQHTNESVSTLLLHIYFGNVMQQFEWYEDDGSTYDFEEGKFSKRIISFSPDDHMISIGAQHGNFESPYKKIKIILHGFDNQSTFYKDGEVVSSEKHEHSFFNALEKFDPIYDPPTLEKEALIFMEFENTQEEILISW